MINRPPNATGRFVRRMIESHSILGVALAALIFVVSLTGAFTVFRDEIAQWESPEASRAASASPQAYEAAVQAAWSRKAAENRFSNILAAGPTPFLPGLYVRLNEVTPDGTRRSTDWVADPRDGRLLHRVDAPLADLVEELHVALHLPAPWGRYLVGLLGVAMFSLIISGVLAHPTIVRDAFRLRLDRGRRVAWTDVHNRLSVWGLPYHLVLTFTGAFLGLAGVIVGAVAFAAYDGDQEAALASINGPQPVEGRTLDRAPPVAAMVRRARAEALPIELVFVTKPDNAGGTTSVNFADPETLDARSALVFRNDGALLSRYGGAGAPGGIRALGTVQPLHYGTFGGYPVKFLYFIMALALTWVTSSGMRVWFHRREGQGRPAPRLHAAWRGMTSGLCLGLAAAALTAQSGAAAYTGPLAFSVWGLLILLCAARPDSAVRAQWAAHVATALILLLAAGARVLVLGWGARTAAGVTGGFVLLGIGLALFAWRDGARRGVRPEASQREPGGGGVVPASS